MRVTTLDSNAFREACLELRALAESDGYRPDIVVAIASGGVYVARAMGYADFRSVSLRRAGTETKRRFLDRVLRRLPRVLADALRMAESIMLSAMQRKSAGVPDPLPLPDRLRQKLAADSPRRILVVDDAVDSGRTLRRVCEALGNFLPDVDLRSAVITVTRRNPEIQPDYTLYDDRRLVRFPWSADYGKPDRIES